MSYTLEISIEEADQLFRQVLRMEYSVYIVEIAMLQGRKELDPVQLEELNRLVELAAAMEVLIMQYFTESEYRDIIL
jgi:hypothetical protein